jgi:hypothetical protein
VLYPLSYEGVRDRGRKRRVSRIHRLDETGALFVGGKLMSGDSEPNL